MILNISIGIIITLVCIEIYFSYFNTESMDNSINEEDITIDEELDEVIEFKEPNPWCKIIVGEITKYFIKINNFDEDKYLEWKKLINSLDYDVETRELILESNSEEEALALINLILSNMNNEIELDEILNKNLIHISIAKAKAHKLVCNKLVELIKEHSNIRTDNTNSEVEYSMDTNENTIEILDNVNKNKFSNEPLNNTFIPNGPSPYGGSEYALL